LKAKETRTLLGDVLEKLGLDLKLIFKTKVDIELIQTESAEIFTINGKPFLVKTSDRIFPTLVFNEFIASAAKAVVDMGAVPYVCNGANIMAPGIRRFEGEFKKGDLVVVLDEKHGKPLAIGEVLYDANEAKKVSQGVVVKNIHFVGDELWKFIKTIETKNES
jgi:PUA domain protein